MLKNKEESSNLREISQILGELTLQNCMNHDINVNVYNEKSNKLAEYKVSINNNLNNLILIITENGILYKLAYEIMLQWLRFYKGYFVDIYGLFTKIITDRTKNGMNNYINTNKVFNSRLMIYMNCMMDICMHSINILDTNIKDLDSKHDINDYRDIINTIKNYESMHLNTTKSINDELECIQKIYNEYRKALLQLNQYYNNNAVSSTNRNINNKQNIPGTAEKGLLYNDKINNGDIDENYKSFEENRYGGNVSVNITITKINEKINQKQLISELRHTLMGYINDFNTHKKILTSKIKQITHEFKTIYENTFHEFINIYTSSIETYSKLTKYQIKVLSSKQNAIINVNCNDNDDIYNHQNNADQHIHSNNQNEFGHLENQYVFWQQENEDKEKVQSTGKYNSNDTDRDQIKFTLKHYIYVDELIILNNMVSSNDQTYYLRGNQYDSSHIFRSYIQKMLEIYEKRHEDVENLNSFWENYALVCQNLAKNLEATPQLGHLFTLTRQCYQGKLSEFLDESVDILSKISKQHLEFAKELTSLNQKYLSSIAQAKYQAYLLFKSSITKEMSDLFNRSNTILNFRCDNTEFTNNHLQITEYLDNKDNNRNIIYSIIENTLKKHPNIKDLIDEYRTIIYSQDEYTLHCIETMRMLFRNNHKKMNNILSLYQDKMKNTYTKEMISIFIDEIISNDDKLKFINNLELIFQCNIQQNGSSNNNDNININDNFGSSGNNYKNDRIIKHFSDVSPIKYIDSTNRDHLDTQRSYLNLNYSSVKIPKKVHTRLDYSPENIHDYDNENIANSNDDINKIKLDNKIQISSEKYTSFTYSTDINTIANTNSNAITKTNLYPNAKSKYTPNKSLAISKSMVTNNVVDTNKSMITKDLRVKLNIQMNEEILQDISCSLIDKILIQGRLYITQSKMIFHSYFNNKSYFGDTILTINIDEIINVEKKHGTYGLDNSIQIKTLNDTITLTSFLHRDKIHQAMQSILLNHSKSYSNLYIEDYGNCDGNDNRNMNREYDNKKLTITQPNALGTSSKVDSPVKLKTYTYNKEKSFENGYQEKNNEIFMGFTFNEDELLINRRQKMLSKIPMLSQFTLQGYEDTIKDTTLYNFFNIIFGENIHCINGKIYYSWWEAYMLKIYPNSPPLSTSWSHILPKAFKSKDLLNLGEEPIIRKIRGTKYIMNKGTLPQDCIDYEETHKLYILDDKEIILYINFKILKQLYNKSDTCLLPNIFIIKYNENNREVSIEQKYYYASINESVVGLNPSQDILNEIEDMKNKMKKTMEEFKAEGKFIIIDDSTNTQVLSPMKAKINLQNEGNVGMLNITQNMQTTQKKISKPKVKVQIDINELKNKQIKEIEDRRKRVLKKMPPLSNYPTSGFVNYVPNTTLYKFFDVVFCQDKHVINGKNYNSWWEYFMLQVYPKKPVKTSEWSVSPPKSFKVKDLIEFGDDPLVRKVIGIKPLKDGIPFLNTLSYDETQILYILDDKEFVLENQVKLLTALPLRDTFVYKSIYIMKQAENRHVTMELRYSLEFVKNTIFKSKIQNSTLDEIADTGRMVKKALDDFNKVGKFTLSPKEQQEEDDELKKYDIYQIIQKQEIVNDKEDEFDNNIHVVAQNNANH